MTAYSGGWACAAVWVWQHGKIFFFPPSRSGETAATSCIINGYLSDTISGLYLETGEWRSPAEICQFPQTLQPKTEPPWLCSPKTDNKNDVPTLKCLSYFLQNTSPEPWARWDSIQSQPSGSEWDWWTRGGSLMHLSFHIRRKRIPTTCLWSNFLKCNVINTKQKEKAKDKCAANVFGPGTCCLEREANELKDDVCSSRPLQRQYMINKEKEGIQSSRIWIWINNHSEPLGQKAKRHKKLFNNKAMSGYHL